MLVFSLTVYSKSSGKKSKNTKYIKVKEFDFTISMDSTSVFTESIAKQVLSGSQEVLWIGEETYKIIFKRVIECEISFE
jgi:hypothetical protein